ncbi:MAG: Capsular glucan synthase [Planctomycetota bacterium]
MKIVQITAGAGGRLCGSCLHDNTLVRALRQRGRDAILLPAYVPTTTDEENVAEPTVVMGGINVFLQQSLPLFRHTPRWLDRLFDQPALLRWLSSRTGDTRPADLGPLTVSSLRGEQGHQRKEVERLARWLAREVRPDVVHLSNALLLGLARRIRETTGAAIVANLSGEDLFIDQLPEPDRTAVFELLVERAADVDRFVALNAAYAERMAGMLACERDRIVVIPHGIDPSGFPAEPPNLADRRAARGGRYVLGFLARACREKGLDQAILAVAQLVEQGHDVELLAAGATVPAEAAYLAGCLALAAERGIAERVRWLGQIDRAGKLQLFDAIDVFLMPTPVPEAKGIPVIEALAAGVPVVASAAGAFPELLGSGSGQPAGLTHRPGDPADLARAVAALLSDPAGAQSLATAGHGRARELHRAEQMAAAHEQLYERVRVEAVSQP